jgi:hypothetical protein
VATSSKHARAFSVKPPLDVHGAVPAAMKRRYPCPRPKVW